MARRVSCKSSPSAVSSLAADGSTRAPNCSSIGVAEASQCDDSDVCPDDSVSVIGLGRIGTPQRPAQQAIPLSATPVHVRRGASHPDADQDMGSSEGTTIGPWKKAAVAAMASSSANSAISAGERSAVSTDGGEEQADGVAKKRRTASQVAKDCCWLQADNYCLFSIYLCVVGRY